MDYLVVNYMKSMIENMLNARLNELTQTANPPFIFAQVSDQEFLISKIKRCLYRNSSKQGRRN